MVRSESASAYYLLSTIMSQIHKSKVVFEKTTDGAAMKFLRME